MRPLHSSGIFLLLCYFGLESLASPTTVSEILSAQDFPLDHNNRVKSHWLLHTNNNHCAQQARKVYAGHSPLRSIAAVDGDAARTLFGEGYDKEKCQLVCIERGARSNDELMLAVFPEKIFSYETNFTAGDDHNWLRDWCQTMEIGFYSHLESPVEIYWMNRDKRVHAGTLRNSEANCIWQFSTLGHRYQAVDSVSGEVLEEITVEFHGVQVIGGPGTLPLQRDKEVVHEIKSVLSGEMYKQSMVKRTFTSVGFKKSKLPRDLWSSISAYYYNNRHEIFREEWEESGRGLYVNWWEQTVFMVFMPWQLKRYWQARLKQLVESWANVELELTDIYGMRRYNQGARLLTHVDRINTHAASLIVNIAQQNINKPWPVEIYDHANRLHEVVMDEGDIVYYESARCLHGRMQPLDGDFYVNLFSHYRPVGDPLWYEKENPPGTPEPIMDIGDCSVDTTTGKPVCTRGASEVMETLSPALDTIRHDDDLFKWWQRTAPEGTDFGVLLDEGRYSSEVLQEAEPVELEQASGESFHEEL